MEYYNKDGGKFSVCVCLCIKAWDIGHNREALYGFFCATYVALFAGKKKFIDKRNTYSWLGKEM